LSDTHFPVFLNLFSPVAGGFRCSMIKKEAGFYQINEGGSYYINDPP